MTIEEIIQSPSQVEVTTIELFQLAMQMHRDKRLAGAEKCYRSLLEIEPDNTNALHYLGILLHQTGRNEEALGLIRRSLEQDAEIGPWYNNLGNVLLATGQYEEAAVAYGKCSELDAANLEVLNNLGVLCGRLNQPEKAISYLERAIAGKVVRSMVAERSNQAISSASISWVDSSWISFCIFSMRRWVAEVERTRSIGAIEIGARSAG